MSDFAEKIRLYRPLIAALILSGFLAAALSLRGVPFADGLMGVFLCFLAGLQLYDLKAFAMTFGRYDPLARRIPAYGQAYPFTEAGLGLLYVAGRVPGLTNAVLLVILFINTTGVLGVLKTGQKVQCACAGTAFSLPVGRVTLAENLAMMAMAAARLAGLAGLS